MDNAGRPPDGEELAALQEQLAGARAEVERLQLDAANAEARAQHAVAEADVLRDDVRASSDAAAAAAADAVGAARAARRGSAARTRRGRSATATSSCGRSPRCPPS